jgi:hypothetical protein
MPRSAVVSIVRDNRVSRQEAGPDDPLKPLSSAEAIQAIYAAIEAYPPECGDCFGLGTELGLYQGQVIWTARNELLCWWLTPPETYAERQVQFDGIRERIQQLVIIRGVDVSSYVEPIQSGFINNRTHDVTALRGERWRITFYPGIRRDPDHRGSGKHS